MKAHTDFEDLLPLYAAGQVNGTLRALLESHLAGCSECRETLSLWLAVSSEIRSTDRDLVAPPGLVDQALAEVIAPNGLRLAFLRTWQILRAQAMLVQPEMRLSSAIVMALGSIMAIIGGQAGVIYFLAPLAAATSMAILYDPEHDPALELSLSTPTSSWKILLARLSVVSGYNLVLSLAATLVLLVFVPPALMGSIILGWLGPMTFLSALALLLSLWIGTRQALFISYSLWLLQYIPFKAVEQWMVSPTWISIGAAYQQFWHTPILLLLLAILLTGLTLFSADRPILRMRQSFE